jgi:hypothetical protein
LFLDVDFIKGEIEPDGYFQDEEFKIYLQPVDTQVLDRTLCNIIFESDCKFIEFMMGKYPEHVLNNSLNIHKPELLGKIKINKVLKITECW